MKAWAWSCWLSLAVALVAAAFIGAVASQQPVCRDFREVSGELSYRVAKLQTIMYLAGHPVFVVETSRTAERQAELYQQGRTAPGQIVTWVEKSPHETGRAVDIAFEGDDPWGEQHPWGFLGAAGKMVGLRWGGPKDRGHFEW